MPQNSNFKTSELVEYQKYFNNKIKSYIILNLFKKAKILIIMNISNFHYNKKID